jgi:hypothetical protein
MGYHRGRQRDEPAKECPDRCGQTPLGLERHPDLLDNRQAPMEFRGMGLPRSGKLAEPRGFVRRGRWYQVGAGLTGCSVHDALTIERAEDQKELATEVAICCELRKAPWFWLRIKRVPLAKRQVCHRRADGNGGAEVVDGAGTGVTAVPTHAADGR